MASSCRPSGVDAVWFNGTPTAEAEWFEVRLGQANCERRRTGQIVAVRRIPTGAAILSLVDAGALLCHGGHSRYPNAARASNRSGLFALREIPEGENITEDFRLMPLLLREGVPLWARIFAVGVDHYWRLLRLHGFLPLAEAVANRAHGRTDPVRAASFPVNNSESASFTSPSVADAVIRHEVQRAQRERRMARIRAVVESALLIVGGVLLLSLVCHVDSLRGFLFHQ